MAHLTLSHSKKRSRQILDDPHTYYADARKRALAEEQRIRERELSRKERQAKKK